MVIVKLADQLGNQMFACVSRKSICIDKGYSFGYYRVPLAENILINMNERDLRKVKNRKKMAGGFQKESGNEMYCAILTVIETLKRRKMGLIESLKKLFMGTQAIF